MLRQHTAEYVARHSPPLRVRSVLAQLHLCRTAALGGQRLECTCCGQQHAVYHSCGQRHCPLCRGAARADWQQRMQQSLLPTAYFQGVFTLPRQLSPLTLGNRRVIYNLLMQSAAAAFRQRMAQERGIDAAPQLVLHTWDQRLEAHPHVHLLHPAGGLSLDGTRWIECPRIQSGKLRGKLYLVDNRQLSHCFRDKFLRVLERLHRRGDLKLTGTWAYLLNPSAWQAFVDSLRQQDWVVYLQPPPSQDAEAENLLKYLARYVTGGPISDARLISHENGEVTFWARDKSKTGQRVPVRLSGVEFVRRWSLHILPAGFHRVRYYGGLHPSRRAAYLARCRELLAERSSGEAASLEAACTSPSQASDPPRDESTEPGPEATARAQTLPGVCPSCGGQLRVVWQRYERSWSDVQAAGLFPDWYLPNGL